jgi:uncharacterized membrane protein YgcG
MSRLLLFTALAVTAFTSCSVYRSGQTKTPDDVYYSPAREVAAYVETERKRDGYYRADDYSSSDDRWLRMRVRDRYRWSAFDDYDWNDWRYNSWATGAYSYSPYSWGFNSYFSNYYYWNSYYNPYCPGIIIVNPKANQPVYAKVRDFNLSRYTNNSYNNSNRPLSASKTGLRYGAPSYNNRNTTTNSSLGSSIRKVFSNDNNSSSRNSYYNPSSSSDSRPTRTYTPSESSSTRSYTPSPSSSSSSSSGSSSSGSSGGGGVSRPSRGN